jgi:hypothetical protein
VACVISTRALIRKQASPSAEIMERAVIGKILILCGSFLIYRLRIIDDLQRRFNYFVSGTKHRY